MLSTLFTFGILRDYAEINPCREVPDLAESAGYPPWEWADVEYAKTHLPPHLWYAAVIALFTGQRLSDVLIMIWNAIADGEISVRQAKTGKPLKIQLHRELRPILDTIPRVSTRILTNSRGLPWQGGFKASWQGIMNKPVFATFRQRRLTFHGLRKSAVCMLLEAGATDAQVSAVTGQSRQMVEHYSLMVNQGRLARAAILAWERDGNGK
jgi:integrase